MFGRDDVVINDVITFFVNVRKERFLINSAEHYRTEEH